MVTKSPSDFINLISNFDPASVGQKKELENIIYEFPYFQLAHAIYLKSLKIQDQFNFDLILKKTAILSSKRKFIKSNSFPYTLNALSDIAEDISIKDRNAEKISKKEIKYLQCKCAENYIGKNFEGSITSAFEFGIFVKILELNIEGFIHVSKLSKKDYLIFDEASISMKSTKNEKSFYVGDILKVKIESVESFKGRVNLSLH